MGRLYLKVGLNPAAIVLALILDPIGEMGLRRTLIINKGNLRSLFSSTISWVLIILSVLSLLSPIFMSKFDKKKGKTLV